MYNTIRNVHLLLASLSLPFLLMYGISAVQMSHPTWFVMRPQVQQQEIVLAPGLAEGRAVARAVMDAAPAIRGDLTSVTVKAPAVTLRITVPGTVHDVHYDAATGRTRVKTSVAGVMGMLNRLHHAAGFWHEPLALNLWGAAVAIVSAALLLVGATGLYMWFLRRTERVTGVVLLAINAGVALVLLALLRSSGP